MRFCLIYLSTSQHPSPLPSFQLQHLTQPRPPKQTSEDTVSLGTPAECPQPNDDSEKAKLRPRASCFFSPRWPCGRSGVIRNPINRWTYCNAFPWEGVVSMATAPQELQVNDGKMMISASWNLSTFNTSAKRTLTAIWVVWFFYTPLRPFNKLTTSWSKCLHTDLILATGRD